MKVLSLYDFTGEALRPWAEFGYQCFAFDIQHPPEGRVEMIGLGHIHYVYADLHSQETLDAIEGHVDGVVFLMGFPVCTDLAVSGAKHFAAKELARPGFQIEAALLDENKIFINRSNNLEGDAKEKMEAIIAAYNILKKADVNFNLLYKDPDHNSYSFASNYTISFDKSGKPSKECVESEAELNLAILGTSLAHAIDLIKDHYKDLDWDSTVRCAVDGIINCYNKYNQKDWSK